jgi:hypothetical protein
MGPELMKKISEFLTAATCGWLLVTSGGNSSGKVLLPAVYETEADCNTAGTYAAGNGYKARQTDSRDFREFNYYSCYPDAQSVKDIPEVAPGK